MISDNKIKHSLEVARLCAELASLECKDESYIQACFVMGLLHDIGYESGVFKGHSKKSVDYIDSAELYMEDIKSAIANHGQDIVFANRFSEILNKADLQVNSKGERVCAFSRLLDIEARYGSDSSEYLNAQSIAERLNLV